MANLPDITTADVGIIAFWNAEDHKDAGVVDPTDCTGVFTNYSVYDNGLDGDISLGSGRLFNCRVKNDGWCMAWIDRTNTFGWPNKSAGDFGETAYKGYYDILWNWFIDSASISSTLTTLSYIISLFKAALETSGNFTFTSADVGHYSYEFVDANVLSMINVHHTSAAETSQTGSVQYTTGTTLYHASIVGSKTTLVSHMYFASNTLLTFGSSNLYAAADVLAENWMPDALTNYDLRCATKADRHTNGSILILWS